MLSIVIPVYNREMIIGKTLLKLVEQQTINNRNFEVIVVDDFSTDKTVEIVEKIASAYSNIKIIKSTNNSGGPSRPRNIGIRSSKGDYIFFLDSDDYLGDEALERLYNFIESYSSDIVCVKYSSVNGRGIPTKAYQKNEIHAEFFKNQLVNTLGIHKLFKREFLLENEIFFKEDITVKEDQVFMMEAYSSTNKISILADYPYYYLTYNKKFNHIGKQLMKFDKEIQRFVYTFNGINKGLRRIEASNDYADKIKAAYLNRAVGRGWISNFPIDKNISEKDKKEWLKLFSQFLAKYCDTNIECFLNNEVRSFVGVLKIGDIDIAKKYKNIVKNINYADVNIDASGKTFQKINIYNKNHTFEEILDITEKNKTKLFIDEFAVMKGPLFYFSGKASLKYPYQLNKWEIVLLIKDRNTGQKLIYNNYYKGYSKVNFEFYVDPTDIVFINNNNSIYDFYCYIKINGTNYAEVRVGNEGNNKHYIMSNIVIECEDKRYNFIPYITTNNNISLRIMQN